MDNIKPDDTLSHPNTTAMERQDPQEQHSKGHSDSAEAVVEAAADTSADGAEAAVHYSHYDSGDSHTADSGDSHYDSGHSDSHHDSSSVLNSLATYIAFPIVTLTSTFILIAEYYNNEKQIELARGMDEKNNLTNVIKPADIALSVVSTLAIITLSAVMIAGTALAGATIGQAAVGVMTLAMAAKCVASIARNLAVIGQDTYKISKISDTNELKMLKKERAFHVKQLKSNVLSLIAIAALVTVVTAFPPAAFIVAATVTAIGAVALAYKVRSVYRERSKLKSEIKEVDYRNEMQKEAPPQLGAAMEIAEQPKSTNEVAYDTVPDLDPALGEAMTRQKKALLAPDHKTQRIGSSLSQKH